jgi:hypothetical protein
MMMGRSFGAKPADYLRYPSVLFLAGGTGLAALAPLVKRHAQVRVEEEKRTGGVKRKPVGMGADCGRPRRARVSVSCPIWRD